MKAIHRKFFEEERVSFWCPGCDTMMSVCPKRWNWNGDTEVPTLSPSILQKCGPYPDGRMEICHCFVRAGNIEFCGDCTHDKRGQTMPLPHFDEVIHLSIAADGGLSWSRKKKV